jgi:RNA polymerase sigma-32 factor
MATDDNRGYGGSHLQFPSLGRKPRLLERGEECALVERWRGGDARAGDELVASCLPFVVSVAREFRHWGMPLEDIVQHGSLGLLRAVKKFDPTRGSRLSTYAVTWIRAEIRVYLHHAYRVARFGTTQGEKRAFRIYRRTGERDPERLAEASGISAERASKLLSLWAFREESLDARVGDAPAPIESLAADTPSAEEQVGIAASRRRVAEAIGRLTERERLVAEGRLMMDDPVSFSRLGGILGISGERVRQIEARVRDKLRSQLASLRPPAPVGGSPSPAGEWVRQLGSSHSEA